MSTLNLFVSVASAIPLLMCTFASAGTATLNPIDRGNFGGDGGHVPSNNNYLVGNENGGPSIRRNFFVFDLMALAGRGDIVSAELQLVYDFYFSADATEMYTLYDITTPWDELLSGDAEVNGFNDLGTGTVYGSRSYSDFDEGPLRSILLNAAALADMNAATGWWGIGGAITTLDADINTSEIINPGTLNSNDLTSTRLVITTIPAPGALAMLGIAVGIVRKRRRS
jgi:hypothetical protein